MRSAQSLPELANAVEITAHRGDLTPPPSPVEPSAVPPRGEFGTQGRADTHELESVAQSREANIVRGDAQGCRTIGPLALIDCVPAFIDRREIPPGTSLTHHPEAALLGVEGESATNRKGLD